MNVFKPFKPFIPFRQKMPVLYLESAIKALFKNDEQGLWYDLWDFSTLSQDAAGTIPVTGVEQPVGRVLDKSQGLELGPELWLNPSPDYPAGATIDDGVYSFTGEVGYVFDWLAALPVGITIKADITCAGRTAGLLVFYGMGGIPPIETNGEFTVYGFTAGDGVNLYAAGGFDGTVTISIKQLKGYHASQTTSTARPKLSSRYNMLVNTDTLATQNATTQATSYVLSFSGAGTVTLSGTATGEKSAGSNTFTATAGTLTLTVSGTVTNAQLVPANQSSIPYQRVGNSPFTLASRTDDYDSDPSKFPRYIQADLVDDKLATTVPAITGQIALATTKGLWIDDITLSAGDFDIGPTTYTGGPAGLLSTLGAQMIGYVLREGTFSASEVSAMTQYYKRKGCPGLLP